MNIPIIGQKKNEKAEIRVLAREEVRGLVALSQQLLAQGVHPQQPCSVPAHDLHRIARTLHEAFEAFEKVDAAMGEGLDEGDELAPAHELVRSFLTRKPLITPNDVSPLEIK